MQKGFTPNGTYIMIGIFDSGLGGLTALKELRKLCPECDIVYFGDTGRVPYGTRSKTYCSGMPTRISDFCCPRERTEFSPPAELSALWLCRT